MHTVRCGFDGIPTVWFGAVLRNRESYGAVFGCCKSYGAVRCGFQNSLMLRCGSVRFSDVVNPTVRFGYIFCTTVRFGAVFQYRKTCGAVRFWRGQKSHGAVRCGYRKNRTVKNPGKYESQSSIPAGSQKNKIRSAFYLGPFLSEEFSLNFRIFFWRNFLYFHVFHFFFRIAKIILSRRYHAKPHNTSTFVFSTVLSDLTYPLLHVRASAMFLFFFFPSLRLDLFRTLQSRAVLGPSQFLTAHMRAVLVDWMVEVSMQTWQIPVPR